MIGKIINENENWFQRIFLEKWRPYFWIAILIFAAYFTTLFFDIVYLDDNVLVTGSYQFNRRLSNVFQTFGEDIFRTPHQGGTFYRPIERLSFMLDAQFGQGAVVFMSHLSNMLYHIGALCLLFALLLKLNIKKETAFLFSVIFAIHPLTAQTVSFIPGRNDSLLAIFVFPSLMFFLEYLKTQKRKYLLGHLILFFLALFTKETAAVLPVIGAAYLVIFAGWRKIRENLKPYLYLGAGWGGILLIWFLARREVLNDFIGNADYNIVSSIFKNSLSLIPAIGKIFLPFELSVFPVMKDMSLAYGIVALAGLIIWLLLAKNKNYRLISFGLLWFLIFIVLTLIKPSGTTAEFSENRIYLPMFGFIFVILGLGDIKFLENVRKKYALIITLAIVLIFSGVTIFRNKYYKNRLSFWNNAVATSSSFAFNHNNLGAMYYLDGRLEEAEAEFDRALELNPRERLAHNNLGLVYMNREDYTKAEEEYKKELEINPFYDNGYANLGLLYQKMNRMDEAVGAWKKTLEINPGHTNTLYILAAYYYNEKNYKEAAYYASEVSQRGLVLPKELQELLQPVNLLRLRQ